MSTPINFSTSTPTHSRQASQSDTLLVSSKKALPLTPIRVNATTSSNSKFDANAIASSDSQKNTPSKKHKSANSAFSQNSSHDTRQGSQEFYLPDSSCAAISAPRLPFFHNAAFASLSSEHIEQPSDNLPNNSEQKKTFSPGFWKLFDSQFSQTTTASCLSSLLNPLNLDSTFQEGWNLGDFDEKSKSLDTNSYAANLRQQLAEEGQLASRIEFPLKDSTPLIYFEDNTLSSPNNATSSAVNQDDDDFDSSEDLTPWAQYSPKSKPGFITPSKGNRDRHSAAMNTPPIASRKNQRNSVTPSKSKDTNLNISAEAQSAGELPFKDSKSTERWYRLPTPFVPGIIIDSHHSKHAPNLCGVYIGGKGDQFLPEDCSPTRQRQILDELMKDEECSHFSTRPKNPFPKELYVPWNGTIVKFSGQVYNSQDDCWYIHFFPVNKNRN